MEVLSSITDAKLASAFDVKIVDNYALVTANNRFNIIDFSSYESPTIVGTIYDTTVLNNARELCIQGDYAFVCCGYYDAMVIIDISNKTNPVIVGTVRNTTYLNGAHAITIQGDYVFVGTNVSPYYITIIDVSNKTSPTIVGYYASAANNSLAIKENYLFATSGSNVIVLDVSDKTAPTLAYTINISGSGLVAAVTSLKITIEGDYLYVNSYNSTYKYYFTSVVNIANLSGTYIVSRVPNGIVAFGGFISGNYFYISGGIYLKAINLSLKDADLISNHTIHYGTASAIDSSGAYMYSADNVTLTIYDTTDLSVVSTLSINIGQYSCHKIYQEGNYLYCCGFSYFKIIDISNKAAPSIKSSLYLGGYYVVNSYSKYQNEDFVYLTKNNILSEIDISNKAAPVLSGRSASSAGSVFAVDNNYIYTIYSGSIKIYNKSDFSLAKTYTNANYAFNGLGHVENNKLYVPATNNTTTKPELVVLDVSNINSISVLGSVELAVSCAVLNKKNNYIFLANSTNGNTIYVYNVSNLNDITLDFTIFTYFSGSWINFRQLGVYENLVGISTMSGTAGAALGNNPYLFNISKLIKTNTINIDGTLTITGANLGRMDYKENDGSLAIVSGSTNTVYIMSKISEGVTFIPRTMII